MASQSAVVSRAAPPYLDAPSADHAKFLSAAATHSYRLQTEEVVLRQHLDMFPPSAFGLNFAERRTSPSAAQMRRFDLLSSVPVGLSVSAANPIRTRIRHVRDRKWTVIKLSCIGLVMNPSSGACK